MKEIPEIKTPKLPEPPKLSRLTLGQIS